MDRDDSATFDLGDRTFKLTKLLENFKSLSSTDERDIANWIKDLQKYDYRNLPRWVN